MVLIIVQSIEENGRSLFRVLPIICLQKLKKPREFTHRRGGLCCNNFHRLYNRTEWGEATDRTILTRVTFHANEFVLRMINKEIRGRSVRRLKISIMAPNLNTNPNNSHSQLMFTNLVERLEYIQILRHVIWNTIREIRIYKAGKQLTSFLFL